MERSDPSYKGQAGYNPFLLAIYDVWVLKFMTRAVWKTSVPSGVEQYRRHLGQRHLDVGPGTGYFIAEAAPPAGTRITLLDPNRHVLEHASRRLASYAPTTVEADVMKPLPVEGPFDSAALSFVLHCLRDPMSNKATAVRNIADVLTPDGVFFGGTVLGIGASHTRSARAFLGRPTSRAASTTSGTRSTACRRSWTRRSATWRSRSPARARCSRRPAPEAEAHPALRRPPSTGRRPGPRAIAAELLHDPSRVAGDAGDHVRPGGELEREPDEVQTGLAGRDAALVHRSSVLAEDRQVDPGQVVAEADAPHDVRDVLEHATALDHRLAVADADGPGHVLDAGRGEPLRLHAHERVALRHLLRDHLAADRVAEREHVHAQEPDHVEHDVARDPAVDVRGDVPAGRAGLHRRVGLRDLERDVAARVPDPDHQDATVAELRGVPVRARVQLDDRRVELRREHRDPRDPGARPTPPRRRRPRT